MCLQFLPTKRNYILYMRITLKWTLFGVYFLTNPNISFFKMSHEKKFNYMTSFARATFKASALFKRYTNQNNIPSYSIHVACFPLYRPKQFRPKKGKANSVCEIYGILSRLPVLMWVRPDTMCMFNCHWSVMNKPPKHCQLRAAGWLPLHIAS